MFSPDIQKKTEQVHCGQTGLFVALLADCIKLYRAIVGRFCMTALLADLYHGVGRLVSWRYWKTCIMALLEDLYHGVTGRLVSWRYWKTCIMA